MTWAEAARQPLCLLTPNLQNRRIIDRAFRTANTVPHARVLSSVLDPCGIHDFLTPAIEHSVGLVVVDRDPVSPMVLAVLISG